MNKSFLKKLLDYYNPKAEILKYFSMMNYATQKNRKPVIFDFSKPETMSTWEKTSDEIRGGYSRCSLSQNGTSLQFSGVISTKVPQKTAIRNPLLGPPLVLARSGYAGCRSLIPWQVRQGYWLHSYDGIEIVVKGDNRTYNLNLYPYNNDSSTLYAIQFQLSQSTEWTTLNLKFKDFAMLYQGKVVGKSPSMYHNRIHAVGLSIQDGYDGEFCLDVKSMAYVAVEDVIKKPKQQSITEYLRKRS